ncbi:MFS transporter [Paraflavitalea pollutisoli]|uniref:MFS transporter n=1 Tax=Paraflavitalea pollutisoli TaxID=3034143 RepID=UPI0023ECD049|nr:MFS transporter [Paraflavitalea sp. H1-2-19X]
MTMAVASRQKMRSGEFIALSACTMMLTALGIDIMLPAFAAVRQHFGLPPQSTATAQIITFFFMGQVAQLLFGILSDRYGRLPILRIGFPLYIIGGVAATFAPSMPVMFAARFLAGIGASAVFTTTIAGVRDRFVGDQMARTMSLILTIFLFTPIYAPFLGIAILSVASWQWVFITPPLFAVVVFVWSLRLEESLDPQNRLSLNWKNVGQGIRKVLANRVFLRYTTITTLLFTALSAYVSSSERIIGEIYGRPTLFAWVFAGIGLMMSVATLTNARLSIRYGAKKTVRWLLLLYTSVAALFFVCTLVAGDPPPMFIFFVAVALILGINLAIEPNSSALAMEPLGDLAGMASSVYGTLFFFVGSALGSFISGAMVHGIWPLVIAFFVIGVICVGLAWGDRDHANLR